MTRIIPSLFPRVEIQNASVSGRSGIGGPQDRGARQTARGLHAHPLDYNGYTQDREWVSLYEKEWTAQKIIDIPVEDMLREGWRYTGVEERIIPELRKLEQDFNLPEIFRECLGLERLLGGAVALLGVEGKVDEPKEPLTRDDARLRFINVIARTELYPAQYDQDPLSPQYGRNITYLVNGSEVHRSRLLVFDGKPLSRSRSRTVRLRFSRMDGFGNSVLAPIWDDIIRAAGTRQAAYHLINQASVWILRTKLRSLQGTNEGEAKIAELEEVANQISMYQAALIDSDPKNGDIQQISASFASVPELLIQFLQIISAASDIPATRFLGQAPGGLNATGESDLENYYNSISSKQKSNLRPHILRVMKMLHPEGTENLDVEFEPLWNSSDETLANIREKDITGVLNLLEAGLITAKEAIAELRARGAVETPIDTSELGEPGEDDDPNSGPGDPEAELEKLRELTPDA